MSRMARATEPRSQRIAAEISISSEGIKSGSGSEEGVKIALAKEIAPKTTDKIAKTVKTLAPIAIPLYSGFIPIR